MNTSDEEEELLSNRFLPLYSFNILQSINKHQAILVVGIDATDSDDIFATIWSLQQSSCLSYTPLMNRNSRCSQSCLSYICQNVSEDLLFVFLHLSPSDCGFQVMTNLPRGVRKIGPVVFNPISKLHFNGFNQLYQVNFSIFEFNFISMEPQIS